MLFRSSHILSSLYPEDPILFFLHIRNHQNTQPVPVPNSGPPHVPPLPYPAPAFSCEPPVSISILPWHRYQNVSPVCCLLLLLPVSATTGTVFSHRKISF